MLKDVAHKAIEARTQKGQIKRASLSLGMQANGYHVVIPTPHERQRNLSKPIKAGDGEGGTARRRLEVAIRAAKKFLAGKRVLYAAPTIDQMDRFWTETCRIFQDPPIEDIHQELNSAYPRVAWNRTSH